MEATRISYIKDNIYIPPTAAPKKDKLPDRHPSLILSDHTSDMNHPISCGCKGDRCIKDRASWLYAANGELKSANQKDDVNASENSLFKTLIHESVGRQL